MKKAVTLLAVVVFAAFAGEMVSGDSDVTKFSGYASFRWTIPGQEGDPIGPTMSAYSYMAWVPKLNEYVDAKVAATVTAPGDPDFKVCYAYLNLHFTDNFTISGGQMNLPFGYGYTRSGGSMYFADRTAIVGGPDFALYGGEGIATQLTAEFDPVKVDLALSNGNGMNAPADTTVNKQFTGRLTVDPADWLMIGASFASIGQPEIADTSSWSSTGMDFFAVADYPLSETSALNFVGEYMMLGQSGVIPEGSDTHDGSRMSVMAAYDKELDGDVLVAIQPAVRYDSVDPIADVDDNNTTVLDFCLGFGLFDGHNRLQIGGRNFAFEDENVDGYTDIYTKWIMNF